jgi:hypothetical protein
MTTENQSLQSSILQEIKKTGFPTEVVCAGIMQKCGWGVSHSQSYWDEAEKTSREYDLRAYKDWKYTVPAGNYFLDAYLIIECKKSEKPWVFFSTPEVYSTRISQFIKTVDKNIFNSALKSEPRLSRDVLQKTHHYFGKSEMARTFYEPFKGQERSETSQMIYTAIMSSVNATLFHLRDQKIDKYTSIYYPIIIFNGNMYNAHVKSLDDIELLPVQHVQLSFNYMLPRTSERSSIWERNSSWERQERFIIDIVHYEYLEEFLGVLEEEHSKLATHLQNYLTDDN